MEIAYTVDTETSNLKAAKPKAQERASQELTVVTLSS